MNNNEVKCYGIEIEKKYYSESEIMKDLKNVYQMIKRICLKKEQFKGISFIVGISNTDSKDAKPIYLYNHKKGRPKKIIEGTKLGYHFHIYVFTVNSPISIFCNEAKRRLSKKFFDGVYISKNDNPEAALSYLEKQSCHTRRYGDIFRHTFK